ncbi:hypothetical protein [Stratiformator vulcanicus]|uniref:hypothetical protein n=1 Tax=Stratiformator vulcanicus TaxID=2527980 RepID=UPI0028779FA3|nr:hypothetical protein [Stratiformator vulcanicus]
MLHDSCDAHPQSISSAAVGISPERIDIQFAVPIEDLFDFQGLKVDKGGQINRAAYREAVRAHGEFVRDRLLVLGPDGHRFEGRVRLVNDPFATASELEFASILGQYLRYRLDYKIPRALPFLTMVQRFSDPGSGATAITELTLLQAGDEEPREAVLMSHRPVTFQLQKTQSGEEPVNAPLALDPRWVAMTEAVGRPNESVWLYVYVERRCVRVEFLAPIYLFETFGTIDRADEQYLTAAEQRAGAEIVREFSNEAFDLQIDGAPATANSIDVRFFDLTTENLAKPDRIKSLSPWNGLVGFSAVFPTDAPPQSLALRWRRFTREVREVRAICFAEGDAASKVLERRGGNNDLQWQANSTKVDPQLLTALIAPHFETHVSRYRPPSIWPAAVLGLIVGGIAAIVIKLRRLHTIGLVVAGACLGAIGGFSFEPFAAEKPSIRHHTDFAVPVLSQPVLTAEDASVTAIERMYAAYETGRETDAYEILSATSAPELRRQLFFECARAFDRAAEAGGSLEVADLRVTADADAAEENNLGPGNDLIRVQCVWEFRSDIRHWGHVHSVNHRQIADVDLVARRGRWLVEQIALKDRRTDG